MATMSTGIFIEGINIDNLLKMTSGELATIIDAPEVGPPPDAYPRREPAILLIYEKLWKMVELAETAVLQRYKDQVEREAAFKAIGEQKLALRRVAYLAHKSSREEYERPLLEEKEQSKYALIDEEVSERFDREEGKAKQKYEEELEIARLDRDTAMDNAREAKTAAMYRFAAEGKENEDKFHNDVREIQESVEFNIAHAAEHAADAGEDTHPDTTEQSQGQRSQLTPPSSSPIPSAPSPQARAPIAPQELTPALSPALSGAPSSSPSSKKPQQRPAKQIKNAHLATCRQFAATGACNRAPGKCKYRHERNMNDVKLAAMGKYELETKREILSREEAFIDERRRRSR